MGFCTNGSRSSEWHKVPKMAKAKVIPVFNWKVEANMGVISPFTYEIIGSGVEMAAHYATPLEVTVSQKMTQITLSVKVPEEVQKEMEALHIFVRPYTVKKDLRKIQPITKSPYEAYSLWRTIERVQD